MYFKIILLIFCLLNFVLARPTDAEDQENDKYEEIEESEYDSEVGEPSIDDASQLHDESEVTQKSNAIFPQHLPSEQSSHVYPNSQTNDDISENETSETEDSEGSNSNSDNDRQCVKQNHVNEYIESTDNNDQQETAQHFPNREHSNYKTNRRDNSLSDKKENKKTVTSSEIEEGPLLFESVHDQKGKINIAEDNTENEYPNEAMQYSNVRYYGSMNSKNRGNILARNRYTDNATMSRDRRQTTDTEGQNDSIKSQTDTTKGNEEEAIKRHINKLSNDELEQLLSTLSEDKRSLLTKIIMDNNEYLNKAKTSNNEDSNIDLKKREITKKASAVNENSYSEGNQLDIMKQSGNSNEMNTDIPSSTTLTFNSTKSMGDTNPNVTAQSTESSSSSDEFKQANDASNLATSSPENIVSTARAVSEVTSKAANKREINESFENHEESDSQNTNEDDSFLEDEPFFDSVNDDSDLPDDSRNNRKRDTYFENNSDLADSMKSLEDSFPNSNSYDNSNPYITSNMAPLVRVKRDNEDEVIKKKASSVMSGGKMPFIAYRPENDDEDEEAKESDDDGFYVRTSNLAIDADKLEGDSTDNLNNDSKISESLKYKASDSTALENDATSIGSDTDSVLSGSEGVDDNLMFSSCARNKRSDVIDKNSAQFEFNKENEEIEKYGDSSLMDDKRQKVSGNNINLPNYQGNDAFGIPRNCDGEVNRFKRIRRLKHQSQSDNHTSSNE